MQSSHMIASISRAGLAAFASVIISGSTYAAQGPGGGMGTASHSTQTAMAILVYGGVAMMACAGLIGAARRR